jgi:hypothetical protein
VVFWAAIVALSVEEVTEEFLVCLSFDFDQKKKEKVVVVVEVKKVVEEVI